jgi:O-antigen/teichoic acid export membrane protein
MLSFVLFLYIARLLSQTEYGTFIYINMILSILPLFQFGSMHGVIILLPKYLANHKMEKEELFISYNSFSLILQFLSVFVLYLFDVNLSYWILVLISINYILSKYVANSRIYLNSHLEFDKVNLLKALDQIIRPIVIFCIFFIYKNIESIFIAQFITTLISFLVTVKLVAFKFNFIFKIDTIKKIYKIGFFVYLTWGIDVLFRTADRWFISQFYNIDELAIYGFTSALAMNIWLLSMSFFSPYSQLLYKAVAENKFLEVKTIVENTNKKLSILLLIVTIIAIVLYPYLLEFIVHKYYGTYFLFSILVVASIFLSINNMYIYYMISNSYHFILLKYQSVILVINLVLNAIFAYYHLAIVYFSYSTILSLVIYFILVRNYFYKDISKKINLESL